MFFFSKKHFLEKSQKNKNLQGLAQKKISSTI